MNKLRKIVTQAFGIVSFVIICCGLVYLGYYRFANPNLTETQLFMALWKESLGLIVLMIGSGLFEK